MPIMLRINEGISYRIAGGVDKGNDYKDLIPLVNQKKQLFV